MSTIIVRGDLPHDDCVSDVMEKLVDTGVPHEVAAYMAETIVRDFERHKSIDVMVEAMALSLKRSRLYQRLHLWGLSVCIALALINAVATWHYWTGTQRLDEELHRLMQRPPLRNQTDS